MARMDPSSKVSMLNFRATLIFIYDVRKTYMFSSKIRYLLMEPFVVILFQAFQDLTYI